MSHYSGSVPDAERAVDWRDFAACLDEDAELFFPVGTTGPAVAQAEQAKAVCRRCPVEDSCREWALATGQSDGVWGGLTEQERYDLQHPDQPRPVADASPRAATVQELWERYASPLVGGHFWWSGPQPARCQDGSSFTPMQVSFIVDRGRRPVGKLTRSCTVRGCVRHVEDAEERARRGRPVARAAAV